MTYTYVINLARRPDRKEQLLRAWAAAALPTENLHFVEAVDGLTLPADALPSFRFNSRSPSARIMGRKACYLSHRKAIAQAIKENHFPLLILEDDSLPTESLTSYALSHMFLGAEANLVYFGALPVKDRKRAKDYESSLTHGWNALTPGVSLYGGHAYGVPTRAAAEELFTYLLAHPMTFDSALVKYQKQHSEKVAIMSPGMFRQSEGVSDREGKVRWVKT